MKSNIQLKYRNYVVFSHFHGCAVNNIGLSTNITVKKADPFSYVKLNGKNVYKNGTGKLCNYWSDKSKVKVSYKLKKGWKLKTMYSNDHYRDSKKSKYVMTKDKKLKNGSSV